MSQSAPRDSGRHGEDQEIRREAGIGLEAVFAIQFIRREFPIIDDVITGSAQRVVPGRIGAGDSYVFSLSTMPLR